ncbi:MAG TPA: TolC family protein [Longimicrobium sp.]|nr:TolC family protein [Longimicrobium sp.]
MRSPNGVRRAAAGALFLLALAPPLWAQTPVAARPAAVAALSLDDALRLAEDASETVAVARAGVTRARGQVLQARSQRLPQIAGNLSYSRTLASQFSGFGGGAGGDTTGTGPPVGCPVPPATGPYTPNPALPIEQRVDSLEQRLRCAGQGGNPFAGLSSAGFGSENTWRYGVTASQNLFNGGALNAQNRIADAGRRVAEVTLSTQRAQLALDVTQAYFDAGLANQLVDIAEATLAQAETTLRQTTIARQVGNQPEFDLLRAQVSRDNLRPIVIQRRSERDLAYLRLKQLLDLPPDAPLTLTTPLDDARPVSVGRFASQEQLLGDTSTALRAPVRQAAEAVRVQEEQRRIARAASLPNVALTFSYGRVAFPQEVLPAYDDFRTNASVGAGLSVPIFTGGRLRGERLVAEANLAEAQAQYRQTREAASLDTRTALEQLEAAQASWQASSGTVEQARRAYSIAEIRYREGISTQIEVADSRILLQQAEANRAQAARDLAVARVRLALLPDLPFNLGGGARTAPAGAGQNTQQQRPQQQQQPAADPTQAAFTGGGQ